MQTRIQKAIAKDLQKVLEIPEAHEVKNRYRTLRYALRGRWPQLVDSVSKESMCEFLKDVVYLDRKLRQMTEGEEKETKKVLSEEAQIDLGYVPGYKQDTRHRNTE